MTHFSPKAKILVYVFLVSATFFSGSFKITLFLLCCVSIAAIRVPVSTLKRGFVPIMIFLFFTFSSNMFFQEGTPLYVLLGVPITDEGLMRGGILTLRLFILILGAKILTATTAAEDLVQGMGSLLGPVGRMSYVHELMLTMSLTLRLLPIVYDEALELFRHVKNSEGNGLSGKIRLAVSLLTPLFERSLSKAKEMTVAENEIGH